MASSLAGAQCIGNYDAVVIRAGRLGADCVPVYGTNAGIISEAVSTVTADPETDEPAAVEVKNGSGKILISVKRQTRTKWRNLSGELVLWDYEMMELLFGGTLIYGRAGGNYAGEVIGWGEPGPGAASRNPISLEIITQNAIKGAGSCITTTATTDVPGYTGFVFPKCYLTFGSVELNEGAHVVKFSGYSEGNPNYRSGPFRDFDQEAIVGSAPADSPMFMVGYSTLPLNGMAAPTCGYLNTPTIS